MAWGKTREYHAPVDPKLSTAACRLDFRDLGVLGLTVGQK